MLLDDLGFRAPTADEVAAARAYELNDPARSTDGAVAAIIPATILNGRPLVSYSGITKRYPLGLPGAAGRALCRRAGWFLLSPTWFLDGAGEASELRRRAVLHRARHPQHKLVFVVNSEANIRALRAAGEAAFFFNKTATTPEWLFRPLPTANREFDAIYNAQLLSWKRHELTLAVGSCAFIFHRGMIGTDVVEQERAIFRRHAAAPGHVFLNRLSDNDVPIRFSLPEVNRHLNRASVGLCLSEAEGAMFASTEYLLAGLPIVTTPSMGGRDTYFDPEYCWSVPPEADAIAAAVRGLKEKNFPPDYIQARTLQKIHADRGRFVNLLNRLLAEAGSRRRLEQPWPFRKPVAMPWLPVQEAIDRAVYRVVDGYHPDSWLPAWRWRRRLLHEIRRLGGRIRR